MKILVVLGHPDAGSFNHALAQTVCKSLRAHGHEVIFHDLCAEGFEPCVSKEEIAREGVVQPVIRKHCEELRSADGIVVVHPNWWGQPPAVVKGWIDRVFRPDVAYRFEEGDNGEGVPVGLLRAKAALILNTGNTLEQRERTVFGDPLQGIWEKCIFELCGVPVVKRRLFGVIVTSTPQQRAEWLGEVEKLAREVFRVNARCR
jgi:putative NADPH-quinone reductase